MNITQESTGDLTATIQIELLPEDYQTQVNTTLKDLQKKSTLKGFRPGKVPFGMIKKMYGKNVVAEEVNKVLSDALNNYIVENKLEILGYPIANIDKNKEIDFENNTKFEFFFDIGMSPTFDIEISEKTEVDFYDIQVEDKIVDNYLDETRKRFGNLTDAETVEDGDTVVKGEIVQLDADGNVMEEGIKNNTSISLNFIKDKEVLKEFIGKKKEDKIRFNPLKATENAAETSSMLGIKKEDAENLESDFEFTISEISRNEPAKVDKELFTKVFPNENIEDEKQFREKLRSDAKGYYQTESENFFVHNAMDKLIHDTKIDLPDEFVKRWLTESDKKITKESVESDYEQYEKSLKHQLIINKISKDNDIKVEEKNIKDHIKNFYAKQYMIDSTNEEMMKQLDALADSVMQNKEETNKIYDQLLDAELRELFLSKLKKNTKEVTYDEFIKIVNEHHNNHKHEH